MIALIDMDIVLYRTACSSEKETQDVAIGRVKNLLAHILERVEADEYVAYLSSDTNFRKEIYPEYKQNRTAPKPTYLPLLREYAIAELGAIVADQGLEADDMLGISQSDNTIICSLDKDLLQCYGRHYSWEIEGGTPDRRWTKPERFRYIDEYEGNLRLYTQILTGDSTDNVRGCKGIGEKKAKGILKGCLTEKEMIEACLNAYGNEQEFLMNAQCLYVLRCKDDSYLKRYERLRNEN